jgi:hypothetical protein
VKARADEISGTAPNPDQVVVEELATATMGRRRRADFSELAGKWVDDPAFDEIIAAQRQIDPDRWKWTGAGD